MTVERYHYPLRCIVSLILHADGHPLSISLVWLVIAVPCLIDELCCAKFQSENANLYTIQFLFAGICPQAVLTITLPSHWVMHGRRLKPTRMVRSNQILSMITLLKPWVNKPGTVSGPKGVALQARHPQQRRQRRHSLVAHMHGTKRS